MATTRIKDISKTTTDLASDTYGVFDGATNGTQKMSRNDMYADWAAAYVADPTTYNLAPLNSGTNKIDATYLPVSGDTPKGEWNASTNSPSLADGSGTAGDYYDVTTAGTANLGSGPIDFTVGDVVKYNGTTWYKIDSVANILDGSATAADGRSALSVNSKDEDAEATGTKLVGPALYFRGAGPNDFIQVADDDKLTFSTLTEFGTTTETTAWSPDDNTPALTDGTGTLNQHYKIDSDAGTVAQGGSTLSIINGTATTAGQVVYYDGSVWRIKDADDLPFSISAWIKADDITNFCPISKFATVNKEWGIYFDNSDKLNVFCYTDGSNYIRQLSDTALTSYEGDWIHVAFTYGGSGPNSATAFASGYQEIVVYVNGEVLATTGSLTGTYTGMANTSQPVYIGRANTSYSKGHIRDVKIYNRSLSSTEVAQLHRAGDLGFSEQWGGALGGVYTSDFSAGADSWLATRGTVTGNVDSIGGQDDNLSFTVDTSNNTHKVYRTISGASVGKRYRVTADVYIPSTNSHVDGVQTSWDGATPVNYSSPTLDTWFRIENEAIVTLSVNMLRINALDGGSTTVNDPSGNDVLYIRNIKITQLGKLADFRSEDYNESASKLLDRSSNNFVGVGTGVTLVGNQRHISADTIDLKNLPTSSAGLSAGEVWSNGGVLTVV